MSTILTVSSEGVAVIGLQNPPVNALSHSLLRSLHDSFTKATADSSVKAIVITSASGANFSAGADITEFDKSVKAGIDIYIYIQLDRRFVEACGRVDFWCGVRRRPGTCHGLSLACKHKFRLYVSP
jgi:enoyl-CoA hydratase/carnithine racemase